MTSSTMTGIHWNSTKRIPFVIFRKKFHGFKVRKLLRNRTWVIKESFLKAQYIMVKKAWSTFSKFAELRFSGQHALDFMANFCFWCSARKQCHLKPSTASYDNIMISPKYRKKVFIWCQKLLKWCNQIFIYNHCNLIFINIRYEMHFL